MARPVNQIDGDSDALLALAKFHAGQLSNATQEAERLAGMKSHIAVAELWLALGELEKAKEIAVEVYEGAWADGEPYVHRYELDQAQAFLEKIGEPIPEMAPYDPSKHEKYDWEIEVETALDKYKAERALEE